MSFIESISFCLYPGMAIAAGTLLLIGIRQLAKRFLISKTFRDFLLGTLGGMLLMPLFYVSLFLLIVLACLPQHLYSFSPSAPNNYNYAHEFKQWVVDLWHLGLVSLGPGGAAGIIIGWVCRKIAIARNPEKPLGSAVTGATKRPMAELGTMIVLSAIGWVMQFVWPLPNFFALSPPL